MSHDHTMDDEELARMVALHRRRVRPRDEHRQRQHQVEHDAAGLDGIAAELLGAAPEPEAGHWWSKFLTFGKPYYPGRRP